MNPIDERLQAELNDVIDQIENDGDALILTISSTGRGFAVGADISQINTWLQQEDWKSFIEFSHRGQRLMERIANLDIVTVAGINGYALGGGLELALACDIRFAEKSAEMGFPEVDLGLIPGWGGTQRLPELIGEDHAKELIITGRYVDGGRAADLGIVSHVFEDGSVEDELHKLAEVVEAKPVHVIPYLLDAIEQAGDAPLETGLSHELMYSMLASSSEETVQLVEDAASN